MSRHQSRRRRLYGRRLHEIRERRDRAVESFAEADPDASRARMTISVDARTGESVAGIGFAAVALD